ncbi:MAG: phytanoyl-CoA dioxygenase family protein [Pseudomonadota bacterium]
MRFFFEENGYAVAKNFLSQEELHALLHCCAPVSSQYGVRKLLERLPAIKDILFSPKLCALLGSLGYAGAKPVRSLFFNKNAAHNWLVPWHQDLSIAVAQKMDIDGYSKWTIKDGAHYVEPPVAILESILTLRFALDNSDEDNGALRVIPGSHLLGKLKAEEIQILQQDRIAVSCNVQAGDLLLMKPLLLHSSSKAAKPSDRRVIHLETSAKVLPIPMNWAEC